MAALGRLTRERIVAFLSSFLAFTILLSGAVYLAQSAAIFTNGTGPDRM